MSVSKDPYDKCDWSGMWLVDTMWGDGEPSPPGQCSESVGMGSGGSEGLSFKLWRDGPDWAILF